MAGPLRKSSQYIDMLHDLADDAFTETGAAFWTSKTKARSIFTICMLSASTPRHGELERMMMVLCSCPCTTMLYRRSRAKTAWRTAFRISFAAIRSGQTW